jgi:type II secretory pathway component PulF
VRPDLLTLSFFAYSMAQCLGAGLPPRQALELSGGKVTAKGFQEAVGRAALLCDQGQPVADALEQSGCPLPHYFVPVVRAGEVGGRREEAFMFLHEHCYRMNPVATLVRNTWLIPLVCFGLGWVIRAGVMLCFGAFSMAWHFFLGTFVRFGSLAAAVYLVLRIRRVRRAFDFLLLQIPAVREFELDYGAALFFGTFNLVYKTGGLEVLGMLDLALATLRNTCVREDLDQARTVFAERGSFEEAFAQPAMLELTYKGLIATGALGGNLEKSLDHIVRLAREKLEARLSLFQQFLYRAVVFTVGMSIAVTLYMCARTR